MNPWLQIKQEIAKKLKINENEIEEPENFGDLAYPCFSLAKKFKEAPQQIAAKLTAALKGEAAAHDISAAKTSSRKNKKKKTGVGGDNIGDRTKQKKQKAKGRIFSNIKYIKEIKALGPYINFYIDWEQLTPVILKNMNKDYGKGKENKKILIDTYSANPFKSFHIGHIRNAALGESIRRLREFQGNSVKTYSYSGDVGIHVARWLLYFTKHYKGDIPKKDFTKWVSEIYAKASQLGKDSEEFENEAQELNRILDKRNNIGERDNIASPVFDAPALRSGGAPSKGKAAGKNKKKSEHTLKIWKKIRKICYDDYKKIARELDCKIDYYFPESECETPGKKLALSLYKKKKLVKSEGAIGLDLKKYDLGFLILIKSDGTALYSTKDFGLFSLKSKIMKFDKCLYIVGSEQEFYLKQLFKAFELLGLSKAEHHHVCHGLVTLKEGKMSSRLGNVITYEDLRDEMIKKVKEKINNVSAAQIDLYKNKSNIGELTKEKFNKNPSEHISKTAEQIAFAAIKFSMLDMDNNKLIRFDWEQALDFNGKSGPYLQYTCVRANSILERWKKIGSIEKKREKLNASKQAKAAKTYHEDPAEISLLKKIALFPEIAKKSSDQYSPSILTNYLFELAQNFNSFYQKLPVLKAEGDIRESRLKLVSSAKAVLETGLYLLGLEVPEKM
ncbi:MAG: arginine--tRNA ligase [Candidatus Aenigmarchaeota archaeon]|nr:arginine--tRNA ligase [Candidatus Aenigmarchaeota archaeon]